MSGDTQNQQHDCCNGFVYFRTQSHARGCGRDFVSFSYRKSAQQSCAPFCVFLYTNSYEQSPAQICAIYITKIEAMNRSEAKKLADTITNEQLQAMFDNAKAKITNWKAVSKVNKGMTRGTAWNILAKDFDVTKSHHRLAKMNMLREFGEFLPGTMKPSKNTHTVSGNPVHQEPQF